MARQHTKRIISPSFWKTGKKEKYWVKTPKPGKHSRRASMPLLVVIRDVLGFAGTAREAKAIINSGDVMIDGVARKDGATAVGLMDVLTIKTIGKNYRVLPTEDGLGLFEIPEAEAGTKILKVIGKNTIAGGRTQLTFHDGRTLLLPAGEKVMTGYSAVFNLKDGKVEKFIPLDRRTLALVFNGVHMGRTLEISEIKEGSAYTRPTVLMEAGRKSLETLKDYVIAIGSGAKAEITLPKEGEA